MLPLRVFALIAHALGDPTSCESSEAVQGSALVQRQLNFGTSRELQEENSTELGGPARRGAKPAAPDFDVERMTRLAKAMKEGARMNVSGALDVLGALAKGAIEGMTHKEIAAMLHDQYKDAVHNTIEEVSQSMDMEDAAAKGEAIDSQLLSELAGLDYGDTKEKAEGDNVVEYDMLTENASDILLLQQAIASGAHTLDKKKLWTSPVKYCFEKGMNEKSKKAMDHAIQHIENLVPCMKFKEVKHIQKGKCDDGGDKAIYIKSSASGCWSFLGKPQILDVTELNLEANGCDITGIATHEMLHALGMLHEQARPDHNKYIQILWDNILADKKSQYLTSSNAETDEPYDIQSLMHYPDYMFAVWGKKTMKSLVPGKVMGNRMGLTHLDAVQLARMYGCQDSVKKFNLCVDATEPSDRDKCTKGDCICHQDPAKPGELIKVKDPEESDCFRCVLKCPDWSPGRPDCGGCPVGSKLTIMEFDGQKNYYCKSEKAEADSNGESQALPKGALAAGKGEDSEGVPGSDTANIPDFPKDTSR